MKTDVAYEVIDYRDVTPKLQGVVILKTHQNRMRLVGTEDQEFVWNLDDGGLEDDEAHKMVVLHTPQGRIVLVELGLANFQAHVRKHYGPDFPKFTSDEEVNQFFFHGLQQGHL